MYSFFVGTTTLCGTVIVVSHFQDSGTEQWAEMHL